jgi:FkbM family methyltransferase
MFQIANNPKLFALRRRGVQLDLFIALNQPWFDALHIATVIDIGANIGQFSTTINALRPQAQIYSFEPLPDCFEKLKQRMHNVPHFRAFNVGVGDQVGTLVFERSSSSASSSFLKMAQTHREAFPHTRLSQPIDVEVATLDALVSDFEINEPLLIKIDVQGYEDRVLCGGERTIRRATMLLIETSFEILYEEQALFDDIYRRLTEWGFSFAGAIEQLRSPQDGRILQADSIFIKKEAPQK